MADINNAEQGFPVGSPPTDSNRFLTQAALPSAGSLPASTLLGRGSAGGAGAMQTITLDASLTMTGTVLSSSGGGGGTGSWSRPFMIMGG